MIVNCIIQARMGSTRFPGKVMTEVGGKPLIGHLLDNLKGCGADRIIVAIPWEDQNTELPDYLSRYGGISVYLDVEHDPNDVAGRFVRVLTAAPCDAFVRVCGDSPLMSAEVVGLVVSEMRAGAPFQLASGGVPGLQAEGVNSQLFLDAYQKMDAEEREHVTLFFKRRLSCVVDTPEDLERLRPVLDGTMEAGEWAQQALLK